MIAEDQLVDYGRGEQDARTHGRDPPGRPLSLGNDAIHALARRRFRRRERNLVPLIGFFARRARDAGSQRLASFCIVSVSGRLWGHRPTSVGEILFEV